MILRNKTVVCLAALLLSGTTLADTFSREVVVNNQSRYTVNTVGKINNYITFDIKPELTPSSAQVLNMVFDTGGWFSRKHPSSVINFSVRCPSGEVDTILIQVNEDGVQASSFDSKCVTINPDSQAVQFSGPHALAQINIDNK